MNSSNIPRCPAPAQAHIISIVREDGYTWIKLLKGLKPAQRSMNGSIRSTAAAVFSA